MKRRSFLVLCRFPLFAMLCIPLFSVPLPAQDDLYNHPELNWFTIETEHFYVHYHNGAERTARVIAKVAEEIYGPVTTLYNHEPDQKVSFVVKDYDDYSNGAAYFYDNKIEIWAPALDFDLRGTHNWLRNVVTHEFTHIVQIQTAMKFGRRVPGFYIQWLGYESERRQDVLYGYPNVIVSYPISGFVVPSWFAEGVAQYNRPELGYENWDSHRDMILRMYALDGNMLTWSEMSVFGKTSLGNESSYNAGYALVKYIAETYGADAIPRISGNLARLPELTIDGAIRRAVGKSGNAVYDDWKEHITSEYRRRIAPILKNTVEGKTISSTGFGNFFPKFSPDGKHIAYTSTKEADYFGLSSIYLFSVAEDAEKKVVDKVHSALSWSPDGRKIFYSKTTRRNPHWSEVSDVYEYDLEREDETRLTFGLRALNPSVSNDGKKLAFAVESDGTMNIGVSDADGKHVRMVTEFRNGEQVFTPQWSPDGTSIVFGYSLREAQDIGRVLVSDGRIEWLITGDDDSRNPTWTPDGKKIIFVSDRTGIFNIYSYNPASKTVDQLTNVLGGAFMPTVNEEGDIAYSAYTSSGFKINLLRSSVPQDFISARYLPEGGKQLASLERQSVRSQFDWNKLRSYDDTEIPSFSSKPYKNIFTSLSIIPFLRVDNYNVRNKGVDYLKPGLYFTSSDVVDKYSIFGGAAMNRLFERDIFFIFEYRDRLVGFHQLGLSPTVSFELYNITRKTSGDIELGLNRYAIGVTYGLLEFDLFLRQKFFSEADELALGFTHSRYSADIGSFVIPGDVNNEPVNVPGSSELYFIGNDLSASWNLKAIGRSRHDEINPVGRKIFLRYDYERNRFNSTGEYEVTQTGLSPKLTPFYFHRIQGRYTEHMQLPFWKHTITLSLRGGTIVGPEVPDFFDFYAGGLVGMKGYPFYSIGGNELATASLAYRFPIWENIDLRLAHLYFDKLYGAVHTDFGNAWNGRGKIRDFKRDVGFELRLESYSFYVYPTRVFFNGTYGLDTFTFSRKDPTIRFNPVQYGKEWRFYFGVLFGFDIL